MSLPSQLDGLQEVRGVLAVDPSGQILESRPGTPDATPDGAATVAVTLGGLAAAGATAGLGPLRSVHVKGASSSALCGARAKVFLHVRLDPARPSGPAEGIVEAWTRGEEAPAPAAAPPAPAAGSRPPPLSPTRASPPAAAPPPAAVPTPGPGPRPTADPATPAMKPPADAWAALRRALGRGHLSEAIARKRDLAQASAAGRPGAEPVPEEERERALQALLEGVGSVMAGDGVVGGRILGELASQENLSFRWLALHWGARAALRSGNLAAARTHVQGALTLARQLDIEARALSQWTAAEVLAHDSDTTRALAWLSEARSRFDRIGDRWGTGQAWLSEARLQTSLRREQAAAEAARQAAAAMPDSDEPPVMLARIAIILEDLAEAERLIEAVRTQPAERVRALVEAIRGGVVGAADAAEFLRELDAAPSQRALRALARIAGAAPRFLQAREALAWMLLRLGKYAEAGAIFRGLLGQPLSPSDRASVMLGMGCIANAQRAGKAAAEPLSAVVAAGAQTPPAAAPEDLPPLPSLSASSILARGPQGTAPAPDAMFSGQLRSFELPDLLEFLRSARRTGLLVCSSASGMGALRFVNGFVTAGASPATPGLGELLVRAGKLAAHALRGLDLADHLLAAKVVEDGLADAAAVREALEEQAVSAVRELAFWKDGEFAFTQETAAEGESPETSVTLDPQGLLLRVFKDVDEESRENGPSAR